MIAPNAADLINEWFRRMRILINVENGKIGCRMRIDETAERQRGKSKKRYGAWTSDRGQGRILAGRSDEWKDALDHRCKERENERKLPELGGHPYTVPLASTPACLV